MTSLPLRVALASVPLLTTAPLLAQRPTPAIEHMKRAATLEYGAVPVGKHTLAELPQGGTWRLGMNEASVLRLELPLLAGDTIVAPGSYRVQLQRTGETACALAVNGSELAVGGSGDGAVPGTLGKAAKPTKKLEVAWRKAPATSGAPPAAPNLPVQLVATFGADELVADATLLGHEVVTLPGWKAALFHVPAARLESGKATPVATFRRGDDQWNLVFGNGKVELVPCMAAPTEQFGFGAVQGPAAGAVVAGATSPLEMKVDAPLPHLDLLGARKEKDQLMLDVGWGSERVRWTVAEPKPKK